LVVRIEKDAVYLKPFAPLTMRFHVEEVKIKRGNPRQREERDGEPGEVQRSPHLGEGEDSEAAEKGEEPEGEPGPARTEAGQEDQGHHGQGGPAPEGEPHPEPACLRYLSQATHGTTAIGGMDPSPYGGAVFTVSRAVTVPPARVGVTGLGGSP
jgi:hypothetical protein